VQSPVISELRDERCLHCGARQQISAHGFVVDGLQKRMLSKKKSEGVQGFRLLKAATATVTAPTSPNKVRYGDSIASLFAAVKIPPTGLEL